MPLPERDRFRIKDLAKRWNISEDDVREEIRAGHFKYLIVSRNVKSGTYSLHFHIDERVKPDFNAHLKPSTSLVDYRREWRGAIHSMEEFPWPGEESTLYITRAEVESFEQKYGIYPDQMPTQSTGGDFAWIQPELLRIAVKVFFELYVLKKVRSKRAHKEQIHDWLNQNHPNLSKRAKEQIATLVNPNKRGGAPPSE